jgi:WhiB family redox-sensing transcriptional regulator
MPRSLDLTDTLNGVADLPWLDRAACAELPLAELQRFFVDAGRTISADTKAMCRRCPVRPDCLAHAYENELTGGYFGGLSPSQRRQLTLNQAYDAIDADAGL